jgi:hypothetical protein
MTDTAHPPRREGDGGHGVVPTARHPATYISSLEDPLLRGGLGVCVHVEK